MPFEKEESGNKATQFRSRLSGNPNGRPHRPVSDLLQKYGKAQSIAVTVDLTKPHGTVEQRIFSTETKDSLFAAIAVVSA